MTDNKEFCKRIEIPTIEYPRGFKTRIKKLSKYMFKDLKERGIDFDTGGIPMSPLPKQETLTLSFFYWIEETNEIIKILNLLLGDFLDLANNPFTFPSYHRERANLLIRTFFSEMFRTKDSFNRFSKELVKQGLVTSKYLKSFRGEFNSYFKDMIKVRNKMIHENISLPGKEAFDLVLFDMVNRRGQFLIDKQPKKELTLRNALINFYNAWAPYLMFETLTLYSFIQNLADLWAPLIFGKPTSHKQIDRILKKNKQIIYKKVFGKSEKEQIDISQLKLF